MHEPLFNGIYFQSQKYLIPIRNSKLKPRQCQRCRSGNNEEPMTKDRERELGKTIEFPVGAWKSSSFLASVVVWMRNASTVLDICTVWGDLRGGALLEEVCQHSSLFSLLHVYSPSYELSALFSFYHAWCLLPWLCSSFVVFYHTGTIISLSFPSVSSLWR